MEGYACSRFSSGQNVGSGRWVGWFSGGAYHSQSLGPVPDSWLEKACLVLGSGSDRERIGGPDHTMGRQGAKRTTDRDVVADSGKAGAGTGDWYGTGLG